MCWVYYWLADMLVLFGAVSALVVGIAMVCRAVRIFTDWRNLVYNDDDNNKKGVKL